MMLLTVRPGQQISFTGDPDYIVVNYIHHRKLSKFVRRIDLYQKSTRLEHMLLNSDRFRITIGSKYEIILEVVKIRRQSVDFLITSDVSIPIFVIIHQEKLLI